jgi:hypothetical protein
MATLLLKLRFFIIVSLLFAFSGIVNAQCTITGPVVYSSSRDCSSFSTCPIIYIGDGTNPTSLVLDGNLDLNSCSLAPIQLIVNNNANIDFTVQNYDLRLPAGSSITFIGTGTLLGPLSGNCSNSDRIFIGGIVISTCLGSGTPLSFVELVAQGGYNPVSVTPSSASVCGSSGSFSFTATATPFSGATIKWYNASSGGTLLYTGNTFASTISSSTTYYVEADYGTYTTTPRKAVVASVNPLPNAPTVGIITQPTCALVTGSVVLNNLPSGNWTINPGGITGSGSSTTISGLAVGTHNFTVSNGTCTSPSVNVIISPLVTNTYSGGVWSTGSAPTANQNIIFNGSFNSSSDIVACSCQVISGAVIINSPHTLTLTNGISVSGGGSLRFENNASLVQINDAAVNTGNITYRRQTTIIGKFDYTYWSAPVFPQTLINVSPNTALDKFYSFDAATDSWIQENSANNMIKGKGYIIRGPNTYVAPIPPGIFEASFIGVPNNGAITIPVVYPGAEASNLLGNPYPSALNADAFLIANSALLDGTLYFWTHNTPITNNLYTSDDYASYNLTGGVGTGTVAISGGVIPTGKIAAGQGFFATSIAAGTAVFNNSMRVSGVSGNNTQFFKINSNNKIVTTNEKSRLWLNLSNSQGAFKQTLIGYVTAATNDYDNMFDGESFDGNEYVDFYSIIQDKNLVIQGRQLPFDESDEVFLGYKTIVEGAFTLSIDQVDGLLVGKDVFLEDKQTSSYHNLKEGPYKFVTEKGVFNDRFVLKYSNNSLKINSITLIDKNVLVSIKNKQIKIHSPLDTMNQVFIYDLLGRQIYHKEKVNKNELIIQSLESNKQTLIVKIILDNGQLSTVKIIY